MKNIILIAPPAAGKGTLSEILVDKYGYYHISTGNLLREESLKDSDVGKKIKKLLQEGSLVPDDIVFDLLTKKLKSNECSNGYILDGFPRNLTQAYKYEEILSNINQELGLVVVLNTDKETLKKRITGRLICSKCGSVYNSLTGVCKPLVENICDKCGSSLYKREDDNEQSFISRYEIYLEKTKPLIDYYQEKGNLYFIDSSNTDKMLEEIGVILHD